MIFVELDGVGAGGGVTTEDDDDVDFVVVVVDFVPLSVDFVPLSVELLDEVPPRDGGASSAAVLLLDDVSPNGDETLGGASAYDTATLVTSDINIAAITILDGSIFFI